MGESWVQASGSHGCWGQLPYPEPSTSPGFLHLTLMASLRESHPNTESQRKKKALQTKPRKITQSLKFLDERVYTYFVQNQEASHDWV